MTNYIIDMLKRLYKKIELRQKLRRMDDFWYMFGGSCFRLFPPSFYYTHTEEEIKSITEREIAVLYAMIDEYEKANNIFRNTGDIEGKIMNEPIISD